MMEVKTEKSLLQHTKVENMTLQIIRIEESSRGFNRMTCYEITLHTGARVVYKSVESNLERLWYLYDTMKSALHGTRKPTWVC